MNTAIDNLEIHIAREFSDYPAGQQRKDGPFSGEGFRESLLLPRYKEAKEKGVGLVVHLVGVRSFGSSFLEEAFGGLVRVNGVNRRDLRSRLEIAPGPSGNRRYRDAILRYIDRA